MRERDMWRESEIREYLVENERSTDPIINLICNVIRSLIPIINQERSERTKLLIENIALKHRLSEMSEHGD